jgi:hypothetical protein
MPAIQVRRILEIGNDFIEPARNAELVWVFRTHKPVAGFVSRGVGAHSVKAGLGLRGDQFQFSVANIFHGAQFSGIRQETKASPALEAFDILKKSEASAPRTIKGLHSILRVVRDRREFRRNL